MPPKPKIHTEEHIQTLRKLYVDEKKSTTEIAKISEQNFGTYVSAGTIYKSLIANNIPVRDKSESVSRAMSTLDIDKSFINEEIIEWVDGLLLGDGLINYNKNRQSLYGGSRIRLETAQEEWTNYGMSKMSIYGAQKATLNSSKSKKSPQYYWSSSTLTHPDIVDQAARWYPDGRKHRLPKDVRITPASVMLWYLGDGSLTKTGKSLMVRFATCSFEPKDIEEILIPKLAKLGIESKREKSKNDLRIKNKSVGDFFRFIGRQSPIECYQYKFDIPDWYFLRRLSDIVPDQNERWRITKLIQAGRIDCTKSPGGKFFLFDEEQAEKVRDM